MPTTVPAVAVRPTLYLNPSCSKSRAAEAELDRRGVAYTAVRYLDDPPDRATLTSLVARLDGPAADLVRVTDPAFTALGVDPAGLSSADAVVDLLVAHPEVMQRPVIDTGRRAVIARSPEGITDALG